MRLSIHIILLSCFLFLLAACGGNRQNDIQRTEDYNITDPGHTLTVFAPDSFTWGRFVLHEAEHLMAEAWAEQGKEFSIDITDYSTRERDSALTRLNIMIMAGIVPDIIMLDHTPWTDTNSLRDFIGSGAFADIYTFIDNDPNLSRDDFYTNVFEAWEIDGSLYAFPIAFGFDYVGINSTFPQHIIDRFSAFDTISMHELLRIYLDLKEMYPDEFGHLTIYNNYRFNSPFRTISHAMNGFIDFNNSVSNINDPRFITMLEDWRQVYEGQGLFEFNPDRSSMENHPPPMTTLSMYTSRYVFIIRGRIRGPIDALVPESNPFLLILNQQQTNKDGLG